MPVQDEATVVATLVSAIKQSAEWRWVQRQMSRHREVLNDRTAHDLDYDSPADDVQLDPGVDLFEPGDQDEQPQRYDRYLPPQAGGARRSPPGGMLHRGINYEGGAFIPDTIPGQLAYDEPPRASGPDRMMY
jgi:hypothetical protein